VSGSRSSNRPDNGSRDQSEEPLISTELHFDRLCTCFQNVLIGLYENDTPFVYRMLGDRTPRPTSG